MVRSSEEFGEPQSALSDLKVVLGLKGYRAFQELPGQLVLRVIKETKEIRVLKVQSVQREAQVLKV